MSNNTVYNFFLNPRSKLLIQSGPCVIESEEHALKSAETLKKIALKHQVNLVFKSSYDKANRSSYFSFRGPGLDKGLKILQKVQQEFELPVLTDVHTVEEAKAAGEVCEFIQIPAFLCRQTDLIVAAANSSAVVNVKKGQFLSPGEMKNVVAKIKEAGNEKIILVERGTCFGYNNLINDMTSIPIMQSFGYPVCFDGTHSVMKPGAEGSFSGGDRQHIFALTLAALAAGADCLFLESHPQPELAKSDSKTVLSFEELDKFLPAFKSTFEHINSLKKMYVY